MSDNIIIPRREVWLFAIEMEKKLLQNDYKSHWSGSDFRYLFNRMNEEISELSDTVDFINDNGKGYQTMLEAVDVANFSMMIWDNARHRRNSVPSIACPSSESDSSE